MTYSHIVQSKFKDIIKGYKEICDDKKLVSADFDSTYLETAGRTTTESSIIENTLKCILAIHERDDAYLSNTPSAEYRYNLFDLCNKVYEVAGDSLSDINLNVLVADRNMRNEIIHNLENPSQIYENMARRLTVIRSILLKYMPEADIPLITRSKKQCDINEFFKFAGDGFDFWNKENIKVLITDSKRDMPENHKKMLANMGWDIVVDSDGTTQDKGGLCMTANDSTNNLKFEESAFDKIKMGADIKNWFIYDIKVTYTKDKYKDSEITSLYKKLFDKIRSYNRPICVLILKALEERRDSRMLSSIVEDYNGQEKLIFVSNRESKGFNRFVLDNTRDYVDDPDDAIMCIPCDDLTFCRELYGYKKHLIDENMEDVEITLPSMEGSKIYDDNLRELLRKNFEVLHSGVGSRAKDTDKLLRSFCRGEKASWDIIAQNKIPVLIQRSAFDDFIKKIKKALSRKYDENSNETIFLINHKAGFGGTTLARQMVWELCREYPTIRITSYDDKKIVECIQRLYQFSGKGVFILADENDISHADMNKLTSVVRNCDRPCVLLKVQRSDLPSDTKETISLHKIRDDDIELLCSMAKQASELDSNIIDSKDENFRKFMQNVEVYPFLIGLYYIEKDFMGLNDYVKQSVDRLIEEDKQKELDAIRMTAFVNCYGNERSMPRELVNRYLNRKENIKYIDKEHQYATALFYESKEEGHPVICSRHILISKEILEACGVSTFDNARQFIDLACAVPTNDERINELIEILFISRELDLDTEGKERSKVSRLINAMNNENEQEAILIYLIEVYERKECSDDSFNKFMAHLYGHLGMLYRQQEKIQKAIEMSEKAVEYIGLCKDADPLIYHMYGTALKDELIDIFHNDVIYENISELDDKVYIAKDQFLKSQEYHRFFDPYGAISELQLCLEYYKYINKKIKSYPSDKRLYSIHEILRRDIEDIIDNISDQETLADEARASFSKYKDYYYSGMARMDFSNAINFFEGKLTSVESQGISQKELENYKYSLALAIIGKNRGEDGKIDYKKISPRDRERLVELFGDVTSGTPANMGFRDKTMRISACKKWMKIAIANDESVDTGIKIADRWINFASSEPDYQAYHFRYMLAVLSAIDGDRSEVDKISLYRNKCYETVTNETYNTSYIARDRIRYLIVDGYKGMGRLECVDGDIVEIFANSNVKKFSGVITDISPSDNNSLVHVFTVTLDKIPGLKNQHVYFKSNNSNSITESAFRHRLEFAVGFSLERMRAVDASVTDITNKENYAERKQARQSHNTSKIRNQTLNLHTEKAVINDQDSQIIATLTKRNSKGVFVAIDETGNEAYKLQRKYSEGHKIGDRFKAKVMEYDPQKKYRFIKPVE